jgi:nicotinate phosphoribosyltransferase
LSVVREHAAAELACLPEHIRQIEGEPAYAVSIARALHELADVVDRRISVTPSL